MKEQYFNDSLKLLRQAFDITETNRQMHEQEMNHYNVKELVGWNELPSWLHRMTALCLRLN
jgi:hypothetical protein